MWTANASRDRIWVGGRQVALTVWGDGATPPNVSNVNYSHGVNIANSAWVPVRTDGTVQVYTSSPCHILIDIQAGIK